MKVTAHGNYPEKPVKIGQESMDIKKKIGEPAFIDGQNWYYVEIKISQNNLGLRKRYNSDVMKITLDKNGKAANIAHYKMENKVPIVPHHGAYTEKNKTSIGAIFSKIFGNVAPTL